MRRLSAGKFSLKFSLNQTRNGRCLKLWKRVDSEPFVSCGIQVDGMMDEDDLRRAIQTELAFVVDDIVAFYLPYMQGVEEERRNTLALEAERQRTYRARLENANRLKEKSEDSLIIVASSDKEEE